MDIKKSVSILKGSYTLTSEDDKTAATFRLPKGKGFVILNLGIVKLGKECIKYDIDNFTEPLESLQKKIDKLSTAIKKIKIPTASYGYHDEIFAEIQALKEIVEGEGRLGNGKH